MKQFQTVLKSLVLLMALGVSGSSVFGLTSPVVRSPVFQAVLENLPWAGHSHILCGALALLLGCVQISSRLRKKNIKLHMAIGKAYVVCVLLASVGAIATSVVSTTPWSARSAFWLTAIAWPIVTLLGYPRGVPFDPKRHGRFMLHSFALTASAISLRIYLVSMLATGVPFPTAYPFAAWCGFSTNIVILETILWLKSKKQNQPMASPIQHSNVV